MVTALMSRKTQFARFLPLIFLLGSKFVSLEELTARLLAGEKILNLSFQVTSADKSAALYLRSVFANTLQMVIVLPAQTLWLAVTLRAATCGTQQQSVVPLLGTIDRI